MVERVRLSPTPDLVRHQLAPPSAPLTPVGTLDNLELAQAGVLRAAVELNALLAPDDGASNEPKRALRLVLFPLVAIDHQRTAVVVSFSAG